MVDSDLERVWREFGKQTEAGKLLYDLYGMRYRPEKFVNYPKLKTKGKDEKENLKQAERAKSSSNLKIAANKIDYPSVQKKSIYAKMSKVDLIPRRRKEKEIKNEIKEIKSNMIKEVTKPPIYKINRTAQIENLQDNFMFQERTVMPKGARLPGLKVVNKEDRNDPSNRNITSEFESEQVKPKFGKNNRREELDYLYGQIMKEIDERYVYMEEIKKLGKDKDLIIMGEIKERLDELKSIQKMINVLDA